MIIKIGKHLNFTFNRTFMTSSLMYDKFICLINLLIEYIVINSIIYFIEIIGIISYSV